jgi:hypothetical protein
MSLTEQQTHLASRIDAHVQRFFATGERDELALLVSLSDYMGSFEQLMDGSTEAEMTLLCKRYPDFYRFGKVLERLAEGLANGSIPMPK